MTDDTRLREAAEALLDHFGQYALLLSAATIARIEGLRQAVAAPEPDAAPGIVVVGDGSGEPPGLPVSFAKRMGELMEEPAREFCRAGYVALEGDKARPDLSCTRRPEHTGDHVHHELRAHWPQSQTAPADPPTPTRDSAPVGEGSPESFLLGGLYHYQFTDHNGPEQARWHKSDLDFAASKLAEADTAGRNAMAAECRTMVYKSIGTVDPDYDSKPESYHQGWVMALQEILSKLPEAPND